MKPRGKENVEAIIEAFQGTLNSLGDKGQPEWKAWLSSAIEVLGQMQDKFFLKTNPAIPVTNRCRRNAEELQAAAANGDAGKFADAWEQIKKDMDELLKRSAMEGVIIT
jgi:hypothetical protein